MTDVESLPDLAAEPLAEALGTDDRRTVLVPLGDPNAAAEVLRKHMGPEDLRRLTLLIAD